jgi:hypothetical protein
VKIAKIGHHIASTSLETVKEAYLDKLRTVKNVEPIDVEFEEVQEDVGDRVRNTYNQFGDAFVRVQETMTHKFQQLASYDEGQLFQNVLKEKGYVEEEEGPYSTEKLERCKRAILAHHDRKDVFV